MAKDEIFGQCLCTKVTIILDTGNAGHKDIGACHCVMCRKWSGGGPFLVLENDGRMQVEGEEFIGVYKSSNWAERAFCTNCGTALYYHLLPTGEKFVSAGLFDPHLFDPQENFTVAKEIYMDQKPDYYDPLSVKSLKLTAEQISEGNL